MARMTTANTQAEIVAEAQSITFLERQMYSGQISMMIRQLKAETGLDYGWSVSKARYGLEIIDRSGKGVKVINMSERMPFFQFHAFMMQYKHVEAA